MINQNTHIRFLNNKPHLLNSSKKCASEITINTPNFMEPKKQLVRELNMRLNSTEANHQGEGHSDQQALTLPSHVWNAYRTVYTRTPQ